MAEKSRTVGGQNVPLDQIQDFNDEFVDDDFTSIYNDEIMPIRNYIDPVEERRCNNLMIVIISMMAFVCIILAEGRGHYLEGTKRAWNAQRDRLQNPPSPSPDPIYHGNLRPYGSDWDIPGEYQSGSSAGESQESQETANSGIAELAYNESDSVHENNLDSYGHDMEGEQNEDHQSTIVFANDDEERLKLDPSSKDINDVNLKPNETESEATDSTNNETMVFEQGSDIDFLEDGGEKVETNSSLADSQSHEYILEEEDVKPDDVSKSEEILLNEGHQQNNMKSEESYDNTSVTKTVNAGNFADEKSENQETTEHENDLDEVGGEGYYGSTENFNNQASNDSKENDIESPLSLEDNSVPSVEGGEKSGDEVSENQKIADDSLNDRNKETKSDPGNESDQFKDEKESPFYPTKNSTDNTQNEIESPPSLIDSLSNVEGGGESSGEVSENQKLADAFLSDRNKEPKNDAGNQSGQSEYPEFVVHKEDDPLYPSKNSPLNPYRPKDTETKEPEVQEETKAPSKASTDHQENQNQNKDQGDFLELDDPKKEVHPNFDDDFTKQHFKSKNDHGHSTDSQYNSKVQGALEIGKDSSIKESEPGESSPSDSVDGERGFLNDDDENPPEKDQEITAPSDSVEDKQGFLNDDEQEPPEKVQEMNFDEGVKSVDLDPSLKHKFSGIERDFVPGQDIPFFWYIPRTAGTSVETMLTRCHGLVGAGNKGAIGGKTQKDALEVLEPFPGEHFVNVEFRTEKGIQRAIDLNLIGSGLVDLVIASRLYQVKDIFNPPSNQARCFTLMRHPVDRAVSLFYYLKQAAHERSYNKEMAHMTIEEYLDSKKAESNWMTRSLTPGKLQGGVLNDEDLYKAMKFLRTKCVIGLTSQFSVSYRRFEAYFELKPVKEAGCENKIMSELALTTKPHPDVKEGSSVWRAFEDLNSFDMKLYNYAVQLFQEQGKFFE